MTSASGLFNSASSSCSSCWSSVWPDVEIKRRQKIPSVTQKLTKVFYLKSGVSRYSPKIHLTFGLLLLFSIHSSTGGKNLGLCRILSTACSIVKAWNRQQNRHSFNWIHSDWKVDWAHGSSQRSMWRLWRSQERIQCLLSKVYWNNDEKCNNLHCTR